jgi:hypothetical protein
MFSPPSPSPAESYHSQCWKSRGEEGLFVLVLVAPVHGNAQDCVGKVRLLFPARRGVAFVSSRTAQLLSLGANTGKISHLNQFPSLLICTSARILTWRDEFLRSCSAGTPLACTSLRESGKLATQTKHDLKETSRNASKRQKMQTTHTVPPDNFRYLRVPRIPRAPCITSRPHVLTRPLRRHRGARAADPGYTREHLLVPPSLAVRLPSALEPGAGPGDGHGLVHHPLTDSQVLLYPLGGLFIVARELGGLETRASHAGLLLARLSLFLPSHKPPARFTASSLRIWMTRKGWERQRV